MIIRNNFFYIYFFLSVLLLITSCDENSIIFNSDDNSGVEYFNRTFPLNSDLSSFSDSPQYINQDLGSALYIGKINDSNMSFALFEIDPDIINNYGICEDNDIESFNDIKLRLVFDEAIYNANDESFVTASSCSDLEIEECINTPGCETIYDIYDIYESCIVSDNQSSNEINNSSYNVENYNNTVQFDNIYQTNQSIYYIKSYFYTLSELESLPGNISFTEDNSNNHENEFIETLVNAIKTPENYIGHIHHTNYKLDFDLTSKVNINEWCQGNREQFYILVEYNPSSNIDNDYIPIISSDNFYINHHPTLVVNYNKSSEVDSLINRFDFINDNIISALETINNIILLDEDSYWDINTNDEWDENNNVIINTDQESDNFGMFLGYQSGINIENQELFNSPIIPVTDSLDIFDITIEINPDTDDSLFFYFNPFNVVFGYQDINNSFDIGELYNDYGIDRCQDSLETGDELINFDQVSCDNENYYVWDSEQQICYLDKNNDDSYSLCGSSTASTYNSEGTENNDILDWEDDGDGIWQEGEGEEWKDKGFDLHSDDYETGCRNTAYIHGIGYNGEENETYSMVIQHAIENGTIDSENFYKFQYELESGQIIDICGKEFWQTPDPNLLISSCPTCNALDPNGDNYNIDPNQDDWETVDNIVDQCEDCNDDGVWNSGEPLENNNQWDWEDSNESGQFEPNSDLHEPFLDYGIDQLPDNLENGDISLDNYNENSNPMGTENNNQYDVGEQFFDTGLDLLFSQQEEYYHQYGKENDGENNIDLEGIFKEFRDYGIDNCPNEYETENGCDETTENSFNFDYHIDDLNIDPNNDNYNSTNLEGTENNSEWNFVDDNENDEWDWEDTNNNTSFVDWENDLYEQCEYFSEVENPLQASVLLGQNLYNLDFEDEDNQIFFSKPQNTTNRDVILWISKIEALDNTQAQYKITISVSSAKDIKGFQFQLSNNKYPITITSVLPYTSSMYPFDFDDLNNNNEPDADEFNEEIKYIQDVSLYPFPDESIFDENDRIISYGYGMEAELYFNDLNNFIYDNDQSLFISEQQTNLVLYFDIASENHNVIDDGVTLNFTGTIGNSIEVSNFISPQLIYDDSDKVSIQLGPFINELLSNSTDLFSNDNDIINAIQSHVKLTLSSYSDNFSTLVLDKNRTSHIDVLYSK